MVISIVVCAFAQIRLQKFVQNCNQSSLFILYRSIVCLCTLPRLHTSQDKFHLVKEGFIGRLERASELPWEWEWERFFPCGDPHRNSHRNPHGNPHRNPHGNPHGIFEYGFIRSSLINMGFTIDTNLL